MCLISGSGQQQGESPRILGCSLGARMASGGGDGEFAAAAVGFGLLVIALMILCIWAMWKCVNTIARAFHQTRGRNRALWIGVAVWVGCIATTLLSALFTQLGWLSPDTGQTIAAVFAVASGAMFFVLTLIAWMVLVYSDDTMRAPPDWDLRKVLTDWWTPLDAA